MPRKPRRQGERGLQKKQPTYNFKARKVEQEDNMSRLHFFMVLGYFISCLIIYNLFLDADLGLLKLFKILCLAAGISFLIPIKLYRRWFTMSMYEYIFLNILGFTTISVALFLTLNSTFRGEVYEERYRIVNVERGHKSYIMELEKDAYADKEYLRTIRDNDKYDRSGYNYLSLYFSDGLFGVRIIENKKLD